MRAVPVFGPDLMASKESIFSGQAYGPDGVFDRVGVELEPAVAEEAGEPFPMGKTIADVFGQLEPEEIIDNCFSNHGFKAAMVGVEYCCRAASRACGVMPRTVASTA